MQVRDRKTKRLRQSVNGRWRKMSQDLHAQRQIGVCGMETKGQRRSEAQVVGDREAERQIDGEAERWREREGERRAKMH